MDVHPEYEQASEEVRARVSASFDRQGLMAHLGARLSHVGPGRAHIALPSRREVTQQHGYFHAGATSAIADSAGGCAALTLFAEHTEVLSVEYKINLLAPGQGEYLEAIGTVVKSGRTLSVCQLEVVSFQGGQRVLVAAGQQTLIRVETRPDNGDGAAG